MYYLSSPWLLPYSQLHNLANAVSGLNSIQYHDWIGVQIIDNITETIRLALFTQSPSSKTGAMNYKISSKLK